MHLKPLALCLLVLLMLALPASALSHTSLKVPTTEETTKPGMLAFWHMDDEGSTETDSTPNANDGVVFGASSVMGAFDKAREFHGDDFIGITNKNFSVNYNISLSMFVKVSAYPSSRASFWSATDDSNVSVWLGLNLTKLQFEVRDSLGKLHVLKATSSFTLKKWTWIASIFNGYDNYMGLFISGNQTIGGAIPKATGQNLTKYHIDSLYASTIVVGATYTNETVDYYSGSIDELIVYDGDLAYLQDLWGKPPPSIPTVSKDTGRYVLVGLAVLGICLFVLIILMSRQMSFNLRAPSTGLLLSMLVGVLAGACLAFAYSPLCAMWGLLFFILGVTLLVFFVLVKLDNVDLMGNQIEQALPLALPILAAILLAVGLVDLSTGALTSHGRPFWLA